MARPDTLLTGSIIAMIAMAMTFDDDETGPAPSQPGPDEDPKREEEVDPHGSDETQS